MTDISDEAVAGLVESLLYNEGYEHQDRVWSDRQKAVEIITALQDRIATLEQQLKELTASPAAYENEAEFVRRNQSLISKNILELIEDIQNRS